MPIRISSKAINIMSLDAVKDIFHGMKLRISVSYSIPTMVS